MNHIGIRKETFTPEAAFLRTPQDIPWFSSSLSRNCLYFNMTLICASILECGGLTPLFFGAA